MSNLLVFFLFFFVFQPIAFSIPVYRSPTSAFPSGDKTIASLKNSLSKVISKTWYLVEANDEQGWIRSSLIFSHWHFVNKATAKSSLDIHVTPAWNSPTKGKVPKNGVVSIRKIEEDWAEIDGIVGWVDIRDLEPDTSVSGYGFCRRNLSLKQKARSDSANLAQLKAGDRVTISTFSGEWVNVSANGRSGYIELAELLTKLDLAKMLRFDHQRDWHPVDQSVGQWIKSGDTYIAIANVTDIEMRQDLLFVSQPHVNLRLEPNFEDESKSQLGFLQPVKLLEKKDFKWAMSKLSSNNMLWWHFEQNQLPRATIDRVASKDLFTNKIYAIATSPIVPNLMFASAKGVFRSTDGENWIRLREFQDQNYPIAVSPSGVIFVGAHRSYDHGKTFEQFIRWEKIADILEKRYGQEPQSLTINNIKIEDKDGMNLTLTIDAGWGKIDINSTNHGHAWQIR